MTIFSKLSNMVTNLVGLGAATKADEPLLLRNPDRLPRADHAAKAKAKAKAPAKAKAKTPAKK